jgi:hypothetical protein
MTMKHHPNIDDAVAELRHQFTSLFGSRTREQIVNLNRALIKAAGYHAVEPKEDAGGNCKVCGEAGRCPGVHAFTVE